MESEVALTLLHAEVMPPEQQRVLRALAPFVTSEGFYLAGGTAIAIQLGHRESVDLDWFTEGEIPDPMALATSLRRAVDGFAATDMERGTLHGVAAGVPLSFLEYHYPSIAPTREWADFECRLASLQDLACMKLSAIAGRGAKKDFIDVYALGREHFTLDQMLDFYRQKYQIGQDVGHVIMSLTHFDDAEEEDTPRMIWDLEWADVKRNLEDWVRTFVRNPGPSS